MRPLLFALTALLSLSIGAQAQAQVLAGGWEVEYDGQGTCMMASEYDAGQGYKAAVVFGIARGVLVLSFVSERWNMNPGAQFRLRMQIDRYWDQWVNVEAHDSETLTIIFEYSRELLNTLAAGRKIYLTDESGESWNFTLHGTSQAVPRLVDCARRHVW